MSTLEIIPIRIGSPIAEAPSHTTVSTDHVYGGSAVVTDKLSKKN